MKKHEQGFELFNKRGGNITNEEIATVVGVSSQTVRKWKSRYGWLEKIAEEVCLAGVTKSECDKTEPVELDEREIQRKRIIDALIEAGTYSPAYDLLIEIYLDAYEEYAEAKREGFADEKQRREIARLLGQLGLDGKNKELVKKSGRLLSRGDEENKKEEKPEPTKVSELDRFRQKRKKGS